MDRDVGHAVFEWNITNVSFLGNIPVAIKAGVGSDNAIESSCFVTPVANYDGEYYWSLLLKINPDRNFANVCLKRKLTQYSFVPELGNGEPEDMFCRARFHCSNRSGDTLLKENHGFKLEKTGIFEVKSCISLSDIYENNSDGIFISDFFTVKCELWFWRCEKRENCNCTESIKSLQLSEDLAELYKSKTFTDVQIETHDGVIEAHRAILASRSGYFSRLLRDNNSCIKMQHSRSQIIENAVEFLYTGDFDLLLEQSLPIEDLEKHLEILEVKGLRWMINPVVLTCKTEVCVEDVGFKVAFRDLGFKCSYELESSKSSLKCEPSNNSNQENFVELSIDFQNFYSPFPLLWQISTFKGREQLCKPTEIRNMINRRGKFSFRQSINRNSYFGGLTCHPIGLSILHSRFRYATGDFLSKLTVDEESKICYSVDRDGNLSRDLNALCFAAAHSDVTLIACDKEFKAHKAILAARSGKFSSIFNEVKRAKRVVIQDVEPRILAELLKYIYVGGNISFDLQAVCHDYLIN